MTISRKMFWIGAGLVALAFSSLSSPTRVASAHRPALDLGFSGRLGGAACSPIAHVSLGRSALRR